MKKTRTLIAKIRKLDLDLIVYEVLKDTSIQREIIELNKDQLRIGVNADNVALNLIRPYSNYYAKLKGSTTVDLKVTGAFYNTFEFRNRKGGFEIVANTTIYGYDFRDVYGNILGLTGDSLDETAELLKPYIIDYIKKYLK